MKKLRHFYPNHSLMERRKYHSPHTKRKTSANVAPMTEGRAAEQRALVERPIRHFNQQHS